MSAAPPGPRKPRVPRGYLLPWGIALLTALAATWVSTLVLRSLASAGLGPAAAPVLEPTLGLAQTALPAMLAVGVLDRALVRRGPRSWLAAGVPVPVLAALVGVLVAASSTGAPVLTVAPVAMLLAGVVAAAASLVVGALRDRAGRRAQRGETPS